MERSRKKWLIFLFWKTQNWTLWICRDQNDLPPVPWSILLTNRCEGSLNRRGLNESAVQFCPNWLSDSDFCSCTVYRMLLGFFFCLIFCLFYFVFQKKILIKVTYIHSNKILCVFLTQCLLLFFCFFCKLTAESAACLMRTRLALILCPRQVLDSFCIDKRFIIHRRQHNQDHQDVYSKQYKRSM